MSRSFFGLLGVTLAALIGCDQTKHTAGGPGAGTAGERGPLYGEKDNTFDLTLSAQSVKQGESKELTIGIKRGTNFSQDVGLRFVDLPAGVTATPASPALQHGDGDTKVMLAAADDAAPGDYTVKVVGHPATGGTPRPSSS